MSRLAGWVTCVVLLCVYTQSVVSQTDQCSGPKLSFNPDADYKFSVITSIRRPDSTDGEKCGTEILPQAIENFATLQWITERMNRNNFPTGIKLVCQISLLRNLDIKEHLQVAEILSELRKDGVLIVGSGFATHKGGKQGAPPSWATEYKTWLNNVLTNDGYTTEERKHKLLQCLDTAPHIDKCHPRIEHFLPLLMCCAASGYCAGRLLYSEFAMESLLNEHYMFD